jgi:hypothetical protein
MASVIFPGNYAELWVGWKRTVSPRLSYTAFGMTNANGWGTVIQGGYNTFADAVHQALKPMIPNTVSLTGSFWRFNPTNANTSVLGTAPVTAPAVVGTRATLNLTSPNCAVLVTKDSGFVGRSGRVFLPVLGENDVDEAGSLVVASQTLFQTAMNNTYTAIDGLEAGAMNNSMKSRPFAAASVVAKPVLTFFVEPLTATQRKRLR